MRGSTALVTPTDGGWFSRTDTQRKTVTFGDASSVRSMPIWSLVSLLLIVGFWWFATNPFGFDKDFESVIDEQFAATADEAQIQRDAEVAAGEANPVVVPSREPMQRDYLTECGQEWDRAKDEVTQQLEAEGVPEPRAPRPLPANANAARQEQYEIAVAEYAEVGPGYEAERDARAAEFALCNPNDYSQWLSPRTLPSPTDTWFSRQHFGSTRGPACNVSSKGCSGASFSVCRLGLPWVFPAV